MMSTGKVFGLQLDIETKVEIVPAKKSMLDVTPKIDSAVNIKKRAMTVDEDPWSATDPWKEKAQGRAGPVENSTRSASR